MHKKIIIFDLLGVITTESMFATNIVYPMVKDKISYDLFKKKYLLYAMGVIGRKEFWEFICAPKEIMKFEKKIIQKTTLTPGVKKIMSDLLASEYILCLATEIPKEWGELLLKKAGIKHMFKRKFYSSDLRFTKPFAKFYKIVFGSIRNNEIFYIDDTLVNLVAAQKVKKHCAILYSPINDVKIPESLNYKIDNLIKIKEICEIKK